MSEQMTAYHLAQRMGADNPELVSLLEKASGGVKLTASDYLDAGFSVQRRQSAGTGFFGSHGRPLSEGQ